MMYKGTLKEPGETTGGGRAVTNVNIPIARTG